MSAGGTFRQTWDIPNVGCFGLDFDFRSGLWLRLWCKGMALAEAIGAISSLRALYPGLDGDQSNPVATIVDDAPNSTVAKSK
ncbi:hypothetical protein UNPA324_30740 [Bradyrhizobium sp. UNPA324]|nr:hypothetical protein UNPA324_30740 [Bradyrhizobium sp. UNPA324]